MQVLPSYKVFYLFILLCLGCEKDPDIFPSEQPVYFEYIYMNQAWGYQHSGWLLDKQGNINYYNLPGNWRFAGEDGISLEDLNYNLSQADTVIGSIDSETLNEKIQLIEDVIDGEITTPVHTACDAGGAALYAYYYDPGKKLYQPVFLAQSGDFESHNTSTAAVELTAWLKQYVLFWLE